MIPSYVTIVLAVVLTVFLLVKRGKKKNKVEGAPLGLPVGSLRALMAIMVVSFPFGYLILAYQGSSITIPSVVLSTIFVVVAFYFEKRTDPVKVEDIVEEICEQREEECEKESEKDFHPLYLPKYSVRSSLVIMLAIIITLNARGPNVPFRSTDTLLELLMIIGFFIVGMFFHALGQKVQEKIIERKLEKFEGTNEELIAQLEKKDKKKKRRRKSFISIVALLFVFVSLTMFTLQFDYDYTIPGFLLISLREVLLLTINVYFGLRQ